MHRTSRSLSLTFAILISVPTLLVAAAGPAAATTPLWTTERAMINSNYFRNTFVFDPGLGNVMSGSQFADPAVDAYYANVGFDRNFMLWAPIEQVEAPDAYWSECSVPPGNSGGLCPVAASFLRERLVSQEFDPGETLHLKMYNGAFIGIVCGNYSERGASGPVPHITGAKYDDLNADGIRESNEPGLSGWQMTLLYNGSAVASTVTGDDGTYSFALDADTLPIGRGTYTVTEEQRTGWTQSQAPSPLWVEYNVGEATFGGMDFGNWHGASISGRKFEDMNADGFDAEDPGLADWTIKYAGPSSGTTTTGEDGAYTLDNLRPGTYRIQEVNEPGWNESAPQGDGSYTLTVTSGQVVSDIDFGNWRAVAISGRKFDDTNVDGSDAGDPGIAGWSISLNDGLPTLTLADGSYSFTDLTPGTYTVAEGQMPGWRQSAPTDGSFTVTLTSGQNMAGLNFGNVCLGAIEVRVPAGVTVETQQIAVSGILENDPALPLTASGTSMFADLLPGTYRVTMILPDGVFSTDPDLTSIGGTFAIVKTVTVVECQHTVVAPPIVQSGLGKITGGVVIALPGGDATSGFEFMQSKAGPRGTLEYNDHKTGQQIHTDDITGIFVSGDESYIFGSATIAGVRYPFRLHLVDAGEPGVNDQFEIIVGNGYTAGIGELISSGNVQLH